MPSAILYFFVRKIVGHPILQRICAVDGAHPVISGGVAVTGWKRGYNHPATPEKLKQKIWSAEAPLIGNRRVETRQMWVNGHKVQTAAQFPGGGLERMIDFNPEEQTITIPVSQSVNPKRLQNAGQLEMIVHQRWAIAILRVKSIDAKDGQACSSLLMNPKVTWSLLILLATRHRRRERKFFLLPDQCTGIAGPTR